MAPLLHTGSALALAGLSACACLLGPVRAGWSQVAEERVLLVDLLDNGAGMEVSDAPDGDPRRLLVPWWIAAGTPRTAPVVAGGLVVAPGASLTQPVAAFAPLTGRLRVHGRVEGAGRVRLHDGKGDFVELAVSDQEFELGGEAFLAQHGRAPQPRLRLELSADAGGKGARFLEVHAEVPLPCPDEAALRAELIGLCDEAFGLSLELGVDRDGPRPTAFLTQRWDVVTGAKLPERSASGIHPLYDNLLDACAVVERPAWRAALAAFLEDFLGLTFHPASGMPRTWDGVSDLPQDANPIEVARYLSFLIDVHERGPEAFRARALAQAEAMAATMLAQGRLPDGSVAVKYNPADGAPNLGVAPLRRLNAAAQLARLAGKNGDARLLDAARSGLAELEFTHFWGGTWNDIDPDFDDSYGNWGSNATTMLAAAPQDPTFRRFTARGFEHFAPLWRDALRFGGSIAADQTRCWELLLRYAEVEPSARAPLDELLRAAVRAHFKGEQYDSGAWGDVTFSDFLPRPGLDVGDFTGTPANLISGLAAAYRKGSGLRDDTTRALFTAVLRSSVATYRREYGWLLNSEAGASNPSGAEVRMLAGVTEMLEQLAP